MSPFQFYVFFPYSESAHPAPSLDLNESNRNASMSLLLPETTLHLNALLSMQKFWDRGNKPGAVRGFELLQKNGLGKLISIKPQRGASMVQKLSTYYLYTLQVNTHCGLPSHNLFRCTNFRRHPSLKPQKKRQVSLRLYYSLGYHCRSKKRHWQCLT